MLLDSDKLRETMVLKGFNVAKLAKAAGVSAVSINQWLNHNKQPRLDTLGRVVNALEVPLGAIVVKG